MSRIAVIGANGQVGAEVCLLLAAQPGVETVPICRNPSGSAFLRWRGLSCRHGRASDPREGPSLLSDCDVVLNFARPGGRPSDQRAANRALIENMTRCSPPGARLVYFSSLSVYRRFRPVSEPERLTAYGWEKREVERIVRRESARAGKGAWILRLGHVAGEIQGISSEMRRLIRGGPVIVPDRGAGHSNVIYTATIVDAVLSIGAGTAPPGTYDLVCSPSWRWRQVLEHEAARCGSSLDIVEPVPPVSINDRGALRLGGNLRLWSMGSRSAREIGLIALTYLPASTNLKAQSDHFRRRAASEIAEISRRAASADAFLIPETGSRYLPSLRPTASLLPDPVFQVRGGAEDDEFAPELSRAGAS